MARRVALQSVYGPIAGRSPTPILQNTPLPSQKTWMNMMSRLENKYGKQQKKKNQEKAVIDKEDQERAVVNSSNHVSPRSKKGLSKHDALPVSSDPGGKKVYRSTVRAMTTKPQRRKKKTQNKSLLKLLQSFPGANRKIKVYPNRSSLCSTVCRAEGGKKEITHFFCKFEV